jgi:hypothetical protein
MSTRILLSLFTSLFAVTVLYAYSSQREIWLALFLCAALVMWWLQQTAQDSDWIRNRERKAALVATLSLLGLMLSFIIFKLLFDIFSAVTASSELSWHAIVHIMIIVVFFAIVIYSKWEQPQHYRTVTESKHAVT